MRACEERRDLASYSRQKGGQTTQGSEYIRSRNVTRREKKPVRPYLEHAHIANGGGGEPPPVDFLLIFDYDIHGHEHVQSVVHAPPNVLLVVVLHEGFRDSVCSVGHWVHYNHPSECSSLRDSGRRVS